METNYRYVSALTGVASIVLFLPCIFKEFSTQEKAVNGDGNAGDETTETLNIAEAEAFKSNDNSSHEAIIKGMLPYFPFNLCMFLVFNFSGLKMVYG